MTPYGMEIRFLIQNPLGRRVSVTALSERDHASMGTPANIIIQGKIYKIWVLKRHQV